MKRFFILFAFIAIAVSSYSQDNVITDECTFRNIELKGRVRYVSEYDSPDIRVKVIDPSFCSVTDSVDFYVEEIDKCFVAQYCGQWSIVGENDLSNFTVAIVESNYDFTIQYVGSCRTSHVPGRASNDF